MIRSMLFVLGMWGVAMPVMADDFSTAHAQLLRDAKFLGRVNRCELLGYAINRPALENFMVTSIEVASEYMNYDTAEYVFYEAAAEETKALNHSAKNILAGAQTWSEMEKRATEAYETWSPICGRYAQNQVYRRYIGGLPSARSFLENLRGITKFDKNNYPIAQD